jgi:hypothetical protein
MTLTPWVFLSTCSRLSLSFISTTLPDPASS